MLGSLTTPWKPSTILTPGGRYRSIPRMRERMIHVSEHEAIALSRGIKTQLRRAVRMPRGTEYDGYTPGPVVFRDRPPIEGPLALCSGPNESTGTHKVPSPYRAGDRLWVRETWQQPEGLWAEWDFLKGPPRQDLPVVYQADMRCDGPWRPSARMPRWASRFTLEVTNVHAEPLQAIQPWNVLAEGLTQMSDGYSVTPFHDGSTGAGPSMAFAYLWNLANPRRRWESNPPVWVVHFNVCKTAPSCASLSVLHTRPPH